MRRALISWLACGAVAMSGSGCALVASATANHNSGGTACIDTPAFAVIDLLIAGVSLAAFVADGDDRSIGWLAVPAVFFASGTIGAIYASRCQGRNEGSSGTTPRASNTSPSFGDAEVDPEATELPAVAPRSQAPRPRLKLQLDREYDLEKHAPRPASSVPEVPDETAPAPERIPCGDAPGTACPADYSCAIAGDDAGYCVTDR